MAIKIVSALPAVMGPVEQLFRAYLSELGVDLSFQDVEGEMAALPGPYAAPGGVILLAQQARQPVGVVALKPLELPHIAELKRLYVSPETRGQGVAERLCVALEVEARARNYRKLKLDTLARLGPANRLYRRLGYTPCAAYNHNPYDDILYFAKDL